MPTPTSSHIFSPVQHKILKKSAMGEKADFSDHDDLAAVSGEFLADVWRGRFSDEFGSPRTISIKGLRIVGDCQLGDKGFPWDGSEAFPGLYAEDCEFDGLLDVSGCRLASLLLDNCRINGSKEKAKSGVVLYLELNAAVLSDVEIVKCRIDGTVGMNNLRASGYVLFSQSTIAGAIAGRGAKIEGLIELERCSIGAPPDAPDQSMDFSNVSIGGDLNVRRSKFEAAFLLYNLNVGSIVIERCRVGACDVWGLVSVRADHMHLRGNLEINQSGFDGTVAFSNSVLEGYFNTCESRFHRNLDLAGVGAEGMVSLANCDVGFANDRCFDASGIDCQQLQIIDSRFRSSVLIFNGRIKESVYIRGCLIGGWFDAELRAFSFYDEPGRQERPSLGLFLHGGEIAGYLQIENCQVFGQVRTERLKISNMAIICRVAVLSESQDDDVSVSAFLMKCDSTVVFSECTFSKHLGLIGSKIYELVIEACEINTQPLDEEPTHAVMATDLVLGRKLRLVTNGSGSNNVLHGGVNFGGSRVGSDIIIYGTVCWANANIIYAANTAFDMENAQIAGSVILRPPLLAAEAARFCGAVVLDGAMIGGDVRLDKTVFEPCGRAERIRNTEASEERVNRDRRGVALSMRSARIEGELLVRQPKIAGLVDLRDASIGTVADGGARKWRLSGVEQGWLMLDGLTYGDLDDVLDGQSPDSPRRQKADAASRRLGWLNLQYPNGKASSDFFVPQPYEQLARFFASEGNEASRRKVLVERRRMQRKHGNLGVFERIVGWLLDVVSVYGYSPGRAFTSLLCFVVVGTAIAFMIDASSAFVLANRDSNPELPFNAAIYALDTAIPLLDLDQESVWAIDPSNLPRPFDLVWPVVWLKGLYEVIGLLIVSILVLTLTGTLREKD